VRVAISTAEAAPVADEPSPTREPKTGAKTAEKRPSRPKAGRSKGNGGRRTVITDEFLVEGKLEKPSAYFILRRSSLDYDWARLDAKFSPLVLESVQDPLF